MSIARVEYKRHKGRRGFTLLEVMLSVAILSMVAMAIYRFVATNLSAIQISSRETAADARYTGFISLLTSQMQELSTEGAIAGEPFKFNEQSQDEISWVTTSGPGLLTRYAAGEFIVTLKLKQGSQGKMEVGFMRQPSDAPEGSDEGQSWVPLIEDVRSLQVRYFDPRLPAWVDKWTDNKVMPRLVRVVIGRPDRSEPMETVLALGRTPLQIVPPPAQVQQPQGGGQPQPQTSPAQPDPGGGKGGGKGGK